MSRRKTILATDEIYHVYNRSNAKESIFDKKNNCNRFLKLADFYRFAETGVRFSYFNRLEKKLKSSFLDSLYTSKRQVQILSFAIMPNHYHFLLRQLKDSGISSFVSRIQNSYAKYYNTKTDRTGSVFQSPFKAKWIETENELLHVSRYIHLNPLTSYLLRENYELEHFEYTSFFDFCLKNPRKFVDTEPILNYFKGVKDFKEFTFSNKDYQRKLKDDT